MIDRYILITTELFTFFFIYFWYNNYTRIGTNLCIFSILKVDSILFSIGFICRYFQLSVKNPFYKDAFIYRYIYYFIVICLTYTINIITWFSYPIICNLFFIILIFPEVLNNLIQRNEFKIIKNSWNLNINNLFTNIVCKYIADIINLISINALNINPKINYLEIKPYFQTEQLKQDNKFFLNFINSFLLVSYLNFLEKNGYLVSTKLLKRYFGICSDVSTRRGPRSNHSKRTYLIRLLQGRQWENLFKPYSLYSFIKIYADNPKKSFFTKFYKIIVSKVRNAFRRILCLCSFGMIYHYGFLSSILSMIFIRKFDTYGHYYYCFFIGTSTIFIYVYDINYTYASIISELIPLLLFNSIGKNLIKNLNKKLIFYVKKYIIVGLYQLDVIFLLCFSIIISYDVTINIYVIILILFLITVIQIFRKLDLFIISITLSVVLIFGRISSYSIFHCIILPVIVSFYYNIFIINLDEKSDFAKSYIALYHDRKDMIRNYF